jgi:hypothetical protein
LQAGHVVLLGVNRTVGQMPGFAGVQDDVHKRQLQLLLASPAITLFMASRSRGLR